MLRAVRRVAQWNWAQHAALNPKKQLPWMHSRLPKIGSRPFSSQVFNPLSDFQGIYCCIDLELDETCKSLWGRIQAAHKTKKAVDVIKEWKDEGNELSEDLMCKLTFKLGMRTWYDDAFKLITWLSRENLVPTSDVYNMLRLDILSRVDSRKAYPWFYELPTKTEASYLILLRSLAASGAVEKAEKVMTELKESKLMTTGRAYMFMMKLYIRVNDAAKAVKAFEEFEASGLGHDSEMYYLLVSNKDTVFSSIPVVEKTEEALPKMPVHRVNRRCILKVHALLGKVEEVDRLWNEMRAATDAGPPELLAGLVAYCLLGNIPEAEKLSSELKSKAGGMSAEHGLALLRMYAKHGDIDRAMVLGEQLEVLGNAAALAHPIVTAYLDKGDFDKALDVFNKYACKDKSLLHPHALLDDCACRLMEEFVKRQDVEGAEELMSKVHFLRSIRLYHSLIGVYVSADKAPECNFRKRMRDRYLWTGSPETKALLSQLKKKAPEQKTEKTEEPEVTGAEDEAASAPVVA